MKRFLIVFLFVTFLFAGWGTTLVVNGAFNTVTTGWTGQIGTNCILSINSQRLQVENGGALYGKCYQMVTVGVGDSLAFSCDAIEGTSGGYSVRLGSTGINTIDYKIWNTTGSATLTQNFIATSTTLYITLASYNNVTGNYALYDNVSVAKWTSAYTEPGFKGFGKYKGYKK